MSDGNDPIEITKQTVELWKITVGTQQHFNTLQLQLRNFALTLYLAVLAAAGFAIKEHSQINIAGLFTTSTAVLICLAGILVVFAFYYMDWGYHQLLKGAVRKGEQIEKALTDTLPAAGLALEISRASSAKRFLRLFPTSSTARLNSFYTLLALALVATAIFAHNIEPVTAQNSSQAPAVETVRDKAKP